VGSGAYIPESRDPDAGKTFSNPHTLFFPFLRGSRLTIDPKALRYRLKITWLGLSRDLRGGHEITVDPAASRPEGTGYAAKKSDRGTRAGKKSGIKACAANSPVAQPILSPRPRRFAGKKKKPSRREQENVPSQHRPKPRGGEKTGAFRETTRKP